MQNWEASRPDNSVEGVHVQFVDYLKLGVGRSQSAETSCDPNTVLSLGSKRFLPQQEERKVALQRHESTVLCGGPTADVVLGSIRGWAAPE